MQREKVREAVIELSEILGKKITAEEIESQTDERMSRLNVERIEKENKALLKKAKSLRKYAQFNP